MINVTAHAATELRSLLKHSRALPAHAVKLTANGKGGLSMTISVAAEGDTVVSRDDIPLLIVAANIAPRLDGLVFDYLVNEVDGQPSRGFTFRKPRADEVAPPTEAAVPV